MLRIKRAVMLIFAIVSLVGCGSFGGHVPKDPWCEKKAPPQNEECKDDRDE